MTLIPRFRRHPLPTRDDSGVAPLCLACGKEIARDEARVELDGVIFHDHCSIYRSWGGTREAPVVGAGPERRSYR
jgi:hypothetical protein